MKPVCLTFFLLQVFLFANSQATFLKTSKPPLDTSVLDKWPSVENPVLSDDGRFAMFTENNIPVGEKTLVIKSLKSNWKTEIVGGRNASFTKNSGKAIFLNQNDSIGIVDLNNYKIRFIPAISSFKLSDGLDQWLAIQIKGNQGLTIENLNNGIQKTFDSVIGYYFSPKGNMLLLQMEHKKNIEAVLQEIIWINLILQTSQIIWEGTQANNFVFSKSDSELAFIETAHSSTLNNKETSKSIWYYRLGGTEKAKLLIDNSFKIINQYNLEIDRISNDGFSENGNLLFLSLIEKKNESMEKYDVKLDVWSYFDPKLQPQQLNEVDNKSVLAVFNFAENEITTLLPANDMRIIKNKMGTIGIVIFQKGEGSEWNWNCTSKPKYYFVDFENGQKREIFEKVEDLYFNRDLAFSPSGKFIVITDRERSNSYSYNIETGNYQNITKNIKIPIDTIENDQPWIKKMKGFEIVSWLKNENTILIRDEFDIWQVDPNAIHSPINITNGFGRKHKIEFRVVQNYSDILTDDTLMLLAFDRITKESGFYKKLIRSQGDPEILSKGNYFYFVENSLKQLSNETNSPKIALVQRQNTFEFPNYFITSDFKKFDALSDLHPELKYNWLRSKLLTFKILDRKKEIGILYKPENFDSTKKYPLIIHYYSKMSNELNIYHVPGSESGFLDICWFVSHGYLVFTPDIHYRIGEPGESALKTIVSAVNYLLKYPWVDGKHLGIQGHSLGGWETNYIVTHTRLFAAACSSSGMSNFVSNYLEQLSDHSNYDWYENRICRIGTTLWENPDLYIKNSPIFDVNKVKTPILIIANKNDHNVQFDQGLGLFMALRRLGKIGWMLQYDDGGHGVNGKARIDYIIRMTQFFDYYLKDTPAPEWMVKGIAANRKGIDSGLNLLKGMKPGHSLLEDSGKTEIQIIGSMKD